MEAAQPAEPSDDALVIRGGHLDDVNIKMNALQHNMAHPDEWVLSICVADDMSVEEIMGASVLRSSNIRVSNAGKLREAGYQIGRSGKFPHGDLVLPGKPTEDMCEHLRSLFGDEEPNPAPFKG